ncbi:Uncharacterized protein FWK35_00008688 [Aphis craccivora]|uniref:Uncharacterized protein n=1 Tax=Aphis craccivora TaxID=307492 RepID=A0A6G0YZW6_APHCR|nr:Uncharacterized protein FWK35_00008688 [Aphis craccivora]
MSFLIIFPASSECSRKPRVIAISSSAIDSFRIYSKILSGIPFVLYTATITSLTQRYTHKHIKPINTIFQQVFEIRRNSKKTDLISLRTHVNFIWFNKVVK